MSETIESVIKDGLRHVERQVDARFNEVDSRVNELYAVKGKLNAGNSVANGENSNAMQKGLHNLIGEEHSKFLSTTPFQTKAVGVMGISNFGNYGGITGTAPISYVDNPIMRNFYDPHLYDLFRIIPTATGSVTFPRGGVPTAGEGSFGAQTEGSAKAQVDYDVTMVNVQVPYVAGYAKVSRQMLQDLPFLQSYLSTSLIEDWNRAINNRYMATITVSSTPGSTSATPVSERIIDYIGQHLALGLGRPDLILTTHAVWTSVLKTLPANGGYSVPGGVAIGQDGVIRIAGVPLVPHSQIPTGRIYVMNRQAFATAQASGLSVRSTESDQDDFIKNLVTYRCEARVELLSFQPTACIYGSAA
jgi:HK97 family phage major capsid protein